ncbi:MAG: SelT/SelW/SelH family protein [Betaproteobacteria bacterium]|nr:SelT/SelW/SelH family protein [Betaproteobacteria bacterium]
MTAEAVKVTISYCAECGYEPAALSLTEYLMLAFKDRLSSIEIIPWYEGSFDVSVEDELVHAMYRDGGFPENQAIGSAIRRHLGLTEGADSGR